MVPADLLLIGYIVGVHGIKGAVKVVTYTDSLDIFQPNQEIWAEDSKGKQQSLIIETVKPYRKIACFALKGITNRNAAENLLHNRLYINKKYLPDLKEGEYYWHDIMGMDVYETEGDFVGKIAAIIETGSNDVYVVRHEDTEILLPALESVIVEINPQAKAMRVNIPEGLR